MNEKLDLLVVKKVIGQLARHGSSLSTHGASLTFEVKVGKSLDSLSMSSSSFKEASGDPKKNLRVFLKDYSNFLISCKNFCEKYGAEIRCQMICSDGSKHAFDCACLKKSDGILAGGDSDGQNIEDQTDHVIGDGILADQASDGQIIENHTDHVIGDGILADQSSDGQIIEDHTVHVFSDDGVKTQFYCGLCDASLRSPIICQHWGSFLCRKHELTYPCSGCQ